MKSIRHTQPFILPAETKKLKVRRKSRFYNNYVIYDKSKVTDYACPNFTEYRGIVEDMGRSLVQDCVIKLHSGQVVIFDFGEIRMLIGGLNSDRYADGQR